MGYLLHTHRDRQWDTDAPGLIHLPVLTAEPKSGPCLIIYFSRIIKGQS